MPDDCQNRLNNIPATRDEIEAALDELLAEDSAPAEPATPAYLAKVKEAKARVSADEAHNAKRLHTHNKRPYRKVGLTIDEWRKTEEGKATRNLYQRTVYAKMIRDTEGRNVHPHNPDPTVESRKAQQRAASKRYRDRKKAERKAREAAEGAAAQAKIAGRAIFSD
jgi:hypothetical protein